MMPEIKNDRAHAEFLPVFRINHSHGTRGEMKCELLCDSMESVAKIQTLYWDMLGEHQARVLSLRGCAASVILRVEGVDSPEQAQTLRGKYLYARRGEIRIAPDQYFICDLIGLPVIDAGTGRKYGVLQDITDNPANQLYHIKTSGGIVLFPVVKPFIDHIDLETGIYISPIPGFFDEET